MTLAPSALGQRARNRSAEVRSVGKFKRTQRIIRLLGNEGVAFLDHALGAIDRLLPHVEVGSWQKCDAKKSKVAWSDSSRKEISLTLVLGVGEGDQSDSVGLRSTLTRSVAPRQVAVMRTIDERERDLCERIINRIATVLRGKASAGTPESLRAIAGLFDEQIVASHLKTRHLLALDLSEVFRELRRLAEQSYENKSISFGCLLEPSTKVPTTNQCSFPSQVLKWKRFRALSDGYRTAYRVSGSGKVVGFEDLESSGLTSLGKHFYPEWADCIAGASSGSVCGVCLTRQGDILVFDGGTLRFTYRFGKWQYWNHAHIIDLLKNRARAQRVPPATIGTVANSIYRAALDVSFRRSGGLFVLLRNRKSARQMILEGDAIGKRQGRTDKSLRAVDEDFDAALPSQLIQKMPRRVMAELAGLDGAIVVDNQGTIVAYGAVLQPKRKGRTSSVEGSRTKAAVGASKYGIAVKVSSDGDIVFYEDGKKFLSV